jgi:predicted nucleic acid-binding protein
MILLDTSVLVEMFRKKDKTKTFFSQLLERETEFAVSAITRHEILIGSNETQTDYWNKFLKFIDVLPFDVGSSTCAVNFYKDLKRKNQLIDLADLAIAATAIAYSLPIATTNTKHFKRVAGLTIIERG